MSISFVGGGLMAEAILGGIIDSGLETRERLTIGEPSSSRRSYLEATYGVKVSDSNSEAIKASETIILAVKPQNVPDIIADLTGSLKESQVVISIIAGIKLNKIIDSLKHDAVIRVMPNTPAQIRSGMSVWIASPRVPKHALTTCKNILKTLGTDIYVEDEKFLDMATAVSASGPAYVFSFIEALIDAGVYIGLSRDMSRKLVLQTVAGSTELIEKTGRHPADLRDVVTSPGGTTAEALMALEHGGFHGIILDAVAAAYNKSKTLGESK